MHMTLNGFQIYSVPDRLRYQLPPELLPGVPWPAGFREDFNQWAEVFLGAVPAVPDGQAYIAQGNCVFVSPRTYAALQQHPQASSLADSLYKLRRLLP